MSKLPGTTDLVAIHLRFDPSTEALLTRAIAELAAKQLFVAGWLVSRPVKDLARDVAKVFDVPKIEVDALTVALQFLATQGLAKPIGDKWQLTKAGYERIEADVARARVRLDGVLNRHFPQTIDRNALELWFREASVRFYGAYGARWAAAIGRKVERAHVSHAAVSGLLDSASQKASLLEHSADLTAGFFAFLKSSHADDLEHQWSLGQSLLASRLVAARIGADPVTAEMFRGALLLLDTNILVVAALESHKLAESLALLARTLKALGVELAIMEDTREEWGRAVHAKRIEISKLVEHLPIGLLRDTTDAFIETALDRACTHPEHFETFFDQLKAPPAEFGEGYAVAPLTDPKAFALAEAGRKDTALQQDIIAVWSELRTRKRKGKRAAEHDAVLTKVAEGLSAAGTPCSVLTLDRTMQEHSLRRTRPAKRPIWVSLDALIQVLAADGLGSSVDPSGFAPLLASIIRLHSEPVLNTYTAEDLSLLLDIEERCATLPEEQVRELVATVARARLSGARRDNPELRLAVHRAFQHAKEDAHVSLGAKLQVREEERTALAKRLETSEKRRSAVREAHRLREGTRIRRAATRGIYASGFVAHVVAAGLLVFAWLVSPWFTTVVLERGAVTDSGILIALGSSAIAPIRWFWTKRLPELRAQVNNADSLALADFDRVASEVDAE